MNTTYSTTDILLASYLRINGYPLEKILKDGDRGTFYFSSVDDDLIQTYNLGQSSVEPIAFHNMFRQLTAAVRRV